MIVIADDITGAAEIAGIAWKQGSEVQLRCGCPVCGNTIAAKGTVVIATDTRSMTAAEAAAETRRIASQFPILSFSQFLIFKKTDSALRGHVVAELTALMESTGYRRAVYLPANPSKGRIIRNGTYYIGDKPIHETDFSFDPEFPATTSVLRERFPDAEANGIIMPDAASAEDIRRIVADYNDGHTLFAGAADLFAELLSTHHSPLTTHHSPLTPHHSPLTTHHSPSSTLLLCGSTQSRPPSIGIPVSPMPIDIYDGADDLSLWNTDAYAESHSLILTIPHHHRTGHAAAAHLRSVMARMAVRLVAQHRPDELIIEGGATAWATLQALAWTDFTITDEIAPGVVRMHAAQGSYVTIKPGSYPWH